MKRSVSFYYFFGVYCIYHGLVFPSDELLMAGLIEKFYQRVDADVDVEFRKMFQNTSYEERVQNLTDFMMQRIGGPSYYTEQRGT